MEKDNLEKKIEEVQIIRTNRIIKTYEKGVNRVYSMVKASTVYTQYLPVFYDIGQYYL